jgi:hypothetical protein
MRTTVPAATDDVRPTTSEPVDDRHDTAAVDTKWPERLPP